MTPLFASLLWALVTGLLLRRLLRQFHAFRTGALAVASPGARTGVPTVAVIIPARDETANIAPCLAGIRAQDYPADRLSVFVVDDESRDDTADQVRRVGAFDSRVRLIAAGNLPSGWLGKPRACWLGAAAANAAWLCFLDADVRTAPSLLASAVAAAERRRIDLLSLQPLQELGSLWERLVIPAGMLLIAGAKTPPVAEVSGAAEAEALAVNGQFMLVRAEAYHKLGGHAAVRADVCEDNGLARRLQLGGYRVRVLAGEHLARTRMYRDFASLWEGFSKNAVEILGGTAATLFAAAAGLLVAWAVPLMPLWLASVALRTADAATISGLVVASAASCVVLGVQLGTLRHFRASPLLLPLLPFGFTVAAAIACESVRLRRRGHVRWKGRAYRLARSDKVSP